MATKTETPKLIESNEIESDALDFCHAEGEKFLSSTREAIDALNQRAQLYINLCVVGISALFAFATFSFSSSQMEIPNFALWGGGLCALFLIGAVMFCFSVLNLTDVGFIGMEPYKLLSQPYKRSVVGNYGESSQLKVVQYIATESIQQAIVNNKDVISQKASWLRKAYWTIIASLFIFLSFLFCYAI